MELSLTLVYTFDKKTLVCTNQAGGIVILAAYLQNNKACQKFRALD